MDEVKDLATREQRNLGEVMADLVRIGLKNRGHHIDSQDEHADSVQRMLDWFALADELMKDAPPGPTARELLEEDRDRLERK
jgi:hypothetical protein